MKLRLILQKPPN